MAGRRNAFLFPVVANNLDDATMRFLTEPSLRLLFALILSLALTAEVSAAPSPGTTPRGFNAPQAVWFDWLPLSFRPTRTSVIRVAAVGMALGLFIMYRSKH